MAVRLTTRRHRHRERGADRGDLAVAALDDADRPSTSSTAWSGQQRRAHMDRVNIVWEIVKAALVEGCTVDEAAERANLGLDVGLNADWISSAWLVDGDIYLVDDEEGGVFLFKRTVTADGEYDDELLRHYTERDGDDT
jgi:hypothetical protein